MGRLRSPPLALCDASKTSVTSVAAAVAAKAGNMRDSGDAACVGDGEASLLSPCS
eukprot:CAMPEP_0181375258 /NCGR_PEP_ID=MMETSP1106-20121128/16538_1 /TAXON_ID=81844 /ORGANISM="Mantoniella antarctica, Strain SL-175" /LENGTH=54 /DNA_ID=CAMNT_0023493455 /DNA_START=1 /DNA_END=161 /DNA_ORIENTATION=+